MVSLPGFDASDTALDDSSLHAAEMLLGIALPMAYREVALAFDGAHGDAEFPLPDGEHEAGARIGTWLSWLPWQPHSVWTWLGHWQEHQLPRSVVPIAESGGGDLVCLDYREGAEPAICFWFHELGGEGLYRIADDFNAWLKTLKAA